MPTEPVRRRLPAILSVDDDRQVLDAILTDLRSAYGGRYRIIGASSGDEALEIVRRLRLRNDDLGLVIADQRMPAMPGTTFLAAAKDVYPTLKSVLLTAYADTDAAISAINEVNLDYYVTKPWDPPEERLFPCWTTCWRSGKQRGLRPTAVSASSASAGRPRPIVCVTIWPGTSCPSGGSMSMIMMRRQR